MTAFHDDARHQWEQLLRTVFGIADLMTIQNIEEITVGKLDSLELREFACTYYEPCSFLEHRDLHAVGFSAHGMDCLFFNPLAHEATAFRSSSLAQSFIQRGTFIEPPTDHPHAMSLDGEIDRSDDRAKWEAIRMKYGVMTQRTRDKVFVGRLVLPADPDTATAIRAPEGA